MFPELTGLSYTDDDNIIGRFSQTLKLTTVIKPVFKLDGNLDFNMSKAMILTKVTTTCHVYDGIEVMGTPLGSDTYIRNFVTQNYIKIGRNCENLEP
jgi:hypothetical protein